MSRKTVLSSVMIWLTLWLAACSGAAPKQIAVAPKDAPIAQYPSHITIVYRAYMELKVSDVDRAAGRAAALANDYGGYLTGSQSWYVDGRKVTTLELAVPTANFESLRASLRGLGELVNESIAGDEQTVYGYLQNFSSVTLQLRPGGFSLPPVEPGGWNPVGTAQNAFQVFLTIFGFLADIIIWILIVGGPFFLMYLGARVLYRRLRRPGP